jgi:hypothetical protein
MMLLCTTTVILFAKADISLLLFSTPSKFISRIFNYILASPTMAAQQLYIFSCIIRSFRLLFDDYPPLQKNSLIYHSFNISYQFIQTIGHILVMNVQDYFVINWRL